MKQIETINTLQMILLFQAFITGSTIINIQGPFIGIAENGAWISILLANGLGAVVMMIVLFMYERYPTLSYVQYTKVLMWKPIAYLFGISLALIVILFTANITYGMGQFLTTSMLKESPLYIFHFLIIMVASLTVRQGIEVMARMFHGMLYFLFFIILSILVLNITHYHPEYLQPVLLSGWKPVLHATYVGIGFPYMDIMYFAMILPYLKREKDKPFKRWMYAGLLLNGIILAVTIIASIMVFGPMVTYEKFPIFQLARIIEIGEIIQRVESVFGIALIIGTYMKITMMLFIINEIITQLFDLSNKRAFVFPLGLLVYLFSTTSFNNEIELGESGLIMETILAVSLGFIPLLIVAGRSLVKR
ncbi:GerAB/ArcD/ProY family transporter [Guptibacillus algicola]|uniref:GerAB/ArcD/ProY family transporter n=1 Tax=Guptibacillus algicola TaxID=225844 RepID=UPI001CD587F5|nr:endospore germination permease [Alkalihalobacillus algicola]MCA0988355.1 spore germination protein [Alkalihalobacillus algicola]